MLRAFAVLVAAAVSATAAAQPAPSPASQPASASSPLPAEAFAQLPFLASPQLSPDGRRIAGQLMAEGEERIAIWRLDAPRNQAPLILPAIGAESFRWASDTRLLVARRQFAVLRSAAAIWYGLAHRIYMLDIEANRLSPLGGGTGFFEEVIFVDPLGRYVLLAKQNAPRQDPSVHRVDLGSQQSIEVQRRVPGVWEWFADSAGNVRVGIDYGERRTRIFYRPTPDAPLARVETRELLDDAIIEQVRFDSNSGRGFIFTNAITGRFAAYEFDFATGIRGATLIEHPEFDLDALILSPEGQLDGAQIIDDRGPRSQWLSPALARIQATLDAALPGKSNTIINRSRDGNRILVLSSASNDPGTYYVFDRAARRLEIFASSFERLHGHAFAPVSAIEYRSRDGLRIPGYLTLPLGRDPRNLPLVLMPHGGPFMRDEGRFDLHAQFLASRGYAVLQPNFRGSAGYGREFVEQGFGQLGGAMIDDMEDGVDWLASRETIDPGRVCIYGGSYGGYAAIWAAMRSPQRYRCAISWAGPTDFESLLRHDRRYLTPRRYQREQSITWRGEQRIDLGAISPLRFPGRVTVPTLIAHGEADRRVPVAQARDFIRALQRHNRPIESVIYPKSGHDFGRSEDQLDFLNRVEEFLARHLDMRPAPESPGAAGSLSKAGPSR
ncbi:MAG: alpha/beta hydrolase family protein [Sphingosinicella sp.]